MKHDAFIGQVQNRMDLPSRGEAEAVTRGVLETLGERIPEALAEKLAAQLPPEIGENLRRTEILAGAGSGERFSREEFTRRIAERARLDEPRALYAARVVLEVVREATTEGITDRLHDVLPEELRALLEQGSGRVSE